MSRPDPPDLNFSRVSTKNSVYTEDDRSSIYSQPDSVKSKTHTVPTYPGSQTQRFDTSPTSVIDQNLGGTVSTFRETIGPVSTCTCWSQTSGTFSNITSRLKASVKQRKQLKEDRQAEYLQAEIDKHSEVYAMAMPKALDFFKNMVGSAYLHPSTGSDDQRDRIRGFLKEVLRSGVSVTRKEIEQYGDDIDQACRAPSAADQCFFRLSYIWFNEFTSNIPGRQSQRLSSKVLSSWVTHNPRETIISHRQKAKQEEEKADLARLWKFTHTKYR